MVMTSTTKGKVIYELQEPQDIRVSSCLYEPKNGD